MKENETKTQNKPQSKGAKVVKTIINTIINILIVCVLIASLLIAVMALTSKANAGMSVIFGHTIENIQTDSMKGGSDEYKGGDFAKGDVIISKFTDNIFTNEYKVGDIVTYKTGDINGDGIEDNVCHRIIEVYDDNGTKCYRTKGDNNSDADQAQGDYSSYLRASDISSVFYSDNFEGEPYEGKIIKGFGNILAFLQTRMGFFLCVLLPMIIFFMYELVRVVMNTANYKKAKAEEDKDEAVKAAVAEALSSKGVSDSEAVAENAGEKPAEETVNMTAEELEQFKQFQAFQKMQKAQQEAAEDKPETPTEE